MAAAEVLEVLNRAEVLNGDTWKEAPGFSIHGAFRLVVAGGRLELPT